MPEEKKLVLFDEGKLTVTLKRLCHEVLEQHPDFQDTVVIGLQPRGVFLAHRMHVLLQKLRPDVKLPFGVLDITFHRDDFRTHDGPIVASDTRIDFLIENKKVILIDDVLYTGRSVRAAMDAMLSFGRPEKVELLVLVDRVRKRDLPIFPNYTGIKVNTLDNEKVIVELKESGGKDFIRIERKD